MATQKSTRNEFTVADFSVDMGGLNNIELPDPALLDYYTRLERREIFLNCDIDDSICDFSMQILQWNAEDRGISPEMRKPIKIYINSNGGDVNAVLNLIDIIKLSKTPVYTIGMSKCYSSGGLLLISGHRRYIFPTTTFLLHDGQTGTYNTTSKVLDMAQFTKDQEERIKQYVLENTSIPESAYDANYRKDWFMYSEDMIANGIADSIIMDLDELA